MLYEWISFHGSLFKNNKYCVKHGHIFSPKLSKSSGKSTVLNLTSDGAFSCTLAFNRCFPGGVPMITWAT